jgi:hypothetical protein
MIHPDIVAQEKKKGYRTIPDYAKHNPELGQSSLRNKGVTG